VLSIEPVRAMRPHNDLEYGILQGGKVAASPIWQRLLRGEGQILAIADGGIGPTCRVPTAKLLQNEMFAPQPQDANYVEHGVHVVGIATGDQLGNGLYNLEDGMAPASRLYFQTLGDDLAGVPDDLGSLFASASAAGAALHSNSWGAPSDGTYDAVARSVDAFVFANPNDLVVFSAGNDGGGGTISTPAIAKDVVSVGALRATAPESVASFSSHGPTPDGRIKPTVIGAGEAVMSAASTSACGTLQLSGTSMAAPNVAGGAALVRQYFTQGFYPSGVATPANAFTPSAALLKAMLIASAQNMTGAFTAGSIPSAGQGFGRVTLARALAFPGSSFRLQVNDNRAGLSQGATLAQSVAMNAPGVLKVVLGWMDRPPAAGTGVALVNDLDLEVRAPDGTIYRGNVLTGGASVAGDGADHRNVEEVVLLPQANAGVFTVVVRASNVPTGT
ncbi:MAG TPA: S8 family serine peptidase, partial [Myxococcota bacterium]|nr:S8 family serine peptidase [Myxococcota bacterium]